MADDKKLRDHMVDVHLARRGIRDQRVLKAMRTVSRERFVHERYFPITLVSNSTGCAMLHDRLNLASPVIAAAALLAFAGCTPNQIEQASASGVCNAAAA